MIDRNTKLLALLVLVTVVLPLFWWIAGDSIVYPGSEEEIEITVCSKESVSKQNGHEYMVYAAKETFIIHDFVAFGNGGRFNSADVYAKVKPGKYEAVVYGYRFSLLSKFRNLVKLKRLGDDTTGC
ncbi:hypothetical protein CR969_02485 [Candidatus Saccharibacteria bacterium]|nr:MAG: hypothetical protein CR969_02485 [Candidatus Saccharibacteria bacterium]